MTKISVPTLNVYQPGHEVLAPGLPEERCILTAEARDNLPEGTITIGADNCLAVADGQGGFNDVGLEGPYSPEDSVVIPAYVIAGPDLPVLIAGPGAVFSSQAEVDQISFGFHAVDANGSLFSWEWLDNWEAFGPMVWATAGKDGVASPVFPVTAWL
ncbi:hypothetical protein J7I84_18995 [Arthrobacter sp. ISL-85]|uniref:hypothetical protein n=1 Tax=Arthrobacter sp. ISL-85 TaxID=2819115 RepID=UPI001BECF55A|nr:hypothetical protein [Arthrobacter sp. ISL-85]MBT2568544.1 hypothetical protein [Arthrobacter sp. ISL-85]